MPIRMQARPKRGNAMLEFAMVFPLLAIILLGMFQLGYAFFLYNQLQSAVRAGGRYAAAADFDMPQAGVTFRSNVQNMVAYGSPTGSTAVVTGLAPTVVTVTWQADTKGFPQVITIKIASFAVSVLGRTYQLTNKPQVTYIYVGQAVT